MRHYALVLLMACLVGTPAVALALQCHGRIVTLGMSKYEVHHICGEPAAVDEVVQDVPQFFFDKRRHVYVAIPISVRKTIWTYNFGPTRFIHFLTFREDKLVKIDTGGYGH